MMYKSSKKILVIEDDAVTRNLFIDSLAAEGFDTISAQNGLIGLEKAQTYLPDLVICDILMPDMDGYSVLTTLRQNPPTAVIPFIFLTGSDTKADVRKGMELGADDYLTKPSTVEELLRAIAIRLEKQALLSQWYTRSSHPDATTSATNTAESIFPTLPQLQDVFDYIEAHYHQGITLSNVAEAVGYSPAYLTHRVAKQTGDTVNGWIVRRRMAAARPLLMDTSQSIEQIAAILGYQTTSHFSRQFSQHHGVSPKNWRKQHQTLLNNSRSQSIQLFKTVSKVDNRVPLTCS